ncbi:type VI secretion system baseplate subunit TssG [Acinetobacter boissieri]|uniref:Type VI secretion system protein ImpH n=1 Tax=Acinetobacter boissieri TaxID=1219383 RepID=A0A1G6IJZ7_9GAMM|nr:type VI secretion system baseplate subunit TssG [Acinetobacter boissieri]SDC06808.1 type VI secretion system protein ImpH [Acinetobacter boissieri]
MRTERWWKKSSIVDELFNAPTTFEFIQSIRLLRHVPYHNEFRFWADHFHFDSSINLNFPQAEIEDLQLKDDKIEVKNLIVGLTGIQGALPYVYTHITKQASRENRHEIQKFIGLFNHKLTAQYIDASLAYNLPIRYEIEQENHYLNIVHALSGYISNQHQQNDLEDYFAEFSGLMQGQTNTSHALKTILTCIFKQPVVIKEFIQENFQLNDMQKSSLGGDCSSLLGKNTFCGETVRQIGDKIEIQFSDLSYVEYLQYLPNQNKSEQLKTILNSWCSPTLLVDLRLILRKNEVKPLQLDLGVKTGLGQGCFLMSKHEKTSTETSYALLRAKQC